MKAICIIGIAIALVGCAPVPTTVNFNLACAWENGTEFYGTMDLSLSLEGENQAKYGGEGPITGTALVRGIDGSVLLDAAVSGGWENRMSGGGGDIVDLEFATADSRLSIVTSLDSATAADLDDQCFLSGGMALDAVSGSWHSAPSDVDIELPNVAGAWSIGGSSYHIQDMAIIDDDLYAIRFDGDDYSIVRINHDLPGTTSITTLTADCANPRAIAYDGEYTWIVGQTDAEPDTEPSLLYKYSGSDFSANITGGPVSNEELSIVDAISASGGNLYFHDGIIIGSGMGTIDPATGDTEYLLRDEWNGSTPALSRTSKIEVSSNVMRATTFAPGEWWGEIVSITLPGGALSSSWWSPLNSIGPMASDGTTLYIVQETWNGSQNENRLYAIGL